MKKTENKAQRILFWIELILVMFIPFVVWWSVTPTNILHSDFLFGLLECIGLSGSVLIFFAGIPIGLIGIRKTKGSGKQRVPVIALSIANLSAGIIEVFMLIFIFCMVVLGGVSV